MKILNPRIGKDFARPKYATEGSAGMDLVACIDNIIVLHPDECRLISTGVAIYIGKKDTAALILPRSGLAHKKGLVLGNTVGLIDSDYQGELMMSAWNRSSKSIHIEPGMRIAQLVFIPVTRPVLCKTQEFVETSRGTGGFGHTGT